MQPPPGIKVAANGYNFEREMKRNCHTPDLHITTGSGKITASSVTAHSHLDMHVRLCVRAHETHYMELMSLLTCVCVCPSHILTTVNRIHFTLGGCVADDPRECCAECEVVLKRIVKNIFETKTHSGSSPLQCGGQEILLVEGFNMGRVWGPRKVTTVSGHTLHQK